MPITRTKYAALAGPEQPLNDANTLLLLPCDGTPGSTVFTDTSVGGNSGAGHGNATVVGGAQVGALQIAFDQSLQLNGTDAAIYYPAHPDWAFAGDFTVDFWMRANSLASFSPIIGTWNTVSNDGNWRCYGSGDDSVTFQIFGGAVVTASGLNTGQDYHIAIVRNGTNLRIYCDGIMNAEATDSTNIANGIDLQIGRFYVTALAYFNGNLDEINIKNVASWTDNFTPPSGPYHSG